MQAQTADGELLWIVNAESAEGRLDATGDVANLRGVTARIFDQNRPALDIEAETGQANESEGVLVLEGSVRARSIDGETTLTCDKITYDRQDRVLVATGNVRGAAAGMTVGPANEARAVFETQEEMNGTTAALLLTSLVLTGQGITFRDNAGVMEITGLSSFSITPERENIWNFRGEGTPFTAIWRRQGLTMRANTMTGQVTSFGEGAQQRYELRRGEFAGNIRAEMAGPRGNMTLEGLARWTMVSEDGRTWRFSGQGAPFTGHFPDTNLRVTARQFDGLATRTMGAASETVEWQTFSISGGIRAVLERQEGGRTWQLTATAQAANLNRADRQMVLTGGVVATGNHPALGPQGGTMEAGRVVVTFDSDWRTPINFEAFER